MSDDLPGFEVIAAALRATTERLTREIAVPTADAPDWSEFEWRVAQAVSAMHGISALLATRLLWQGPPEWNAFLAGQREQTLARHHAIGQRLAELHRAADAAGLAWVALKGSALREHSLHHPGERPMGDIDLLVRPEDAAVAATVIQSVGYEPSYRARRHDAFIPVQRQAPHGFAESITNPLHIELHQRVSESLPVEPVDITAQIWPAEVRPGINPYASFAALLRHIALHTSGNMRANAMRFIQLYDCALLARRMGMTDWAELLGPDPRASAWWLYPALALAERYVPGSLPPNVLAELAGICPRRLRERFDAVEVSEVSWSNLHIVALPGLEWARSLRERLRLARNRVFPSREIVADLQSGLHTQPGLDARWYRGSQAARLLRFTFGKPPRVQTLASVRAALGAGRQP